MREHSLPALSLRLSLGLSVAERKIEDLLDLPSNADLSQTYVGTDNLVDGVSYKESIADMLNRVTGATSKTSNFTALVDIPAGTPIYANGPTATYTASINPASDYSQHAIGDSSSFPVNYGTTFRAFASSFVEARDISRNDVDTADYVRFGFMVPAGTHITFESQIIETV